MENGHEHFSTAEGQVIVEEEALKNGMEAKPKEVVEEGQRFTRRRESDSVTTEHENRNLS
jgi:hypothetical protein